MPVSATRLLRKMRGGAQAHLLAADDGRCYVTKFTGNPQGTRVLVNEILAAAFLDQLGILTPKPELVLLTPEFLAANPEVHFQLGGGRQAVAPGFHLGSPFPGDPEALAVYDFLPDTLLQTVVNSEHFRAVLVADKWLANSDARQSIFFRGRVRQWLPESGLHAQQKGFVVSMIDHGYVFDGPHWEFADSPLQGLYYRPLVYQQVTGLDDFQPWLDRVLHFPAHALDDAAKRVPPEWIAGEEAGLDRLLTRLLQRRALVPDLIAACRAGRANPFPRWR